jgi:hypothetical protein
LQSLTDLKEQDILLIEIPNTSKFVIPKYILFGILQFICNFQIDEGHIYYMLYSQLLTKLFPGGGNSTRIFAVIQGQKSNEHPIPMLTLNNAKQLLRTSTPQLIETGKNSCFY